jgi:hypothetical protein
VVDGANEPAGRFEPALERASERLSGGGRTRAALAVPAYVLTLALLVFLCFGVLMLETLFAPATIPVVLVAVTLPSLLLAWRGGATPGAHVAAIVLPAILVPVVGLLGVDVLWASAHGPRPDPAVGLLFASLVVGGLAYLYLRWLRRRPPLVPEVWAVFGVGAGLVLYALTRRPVRWPEWEIWLAAGVLLAVLDGYLHFVKGPDVRHPAGWAAVLVVAVVFTVPLVGPASVRLHAGLPAVIGFGAVVAALGVNARQFTRERPGVARAARHELVPVLGVAFVIVAAAVAGARAGTAGDQPAGQPLPVATVSATPPPEAVAHRPILLFDSGEILRTPVDVDELLASGLVELCPAGTSALEACPTPTSARDLTDQGDLRFRTESFENDSFHSRIYVRVTRRRGHEYLDYWWYLPDNPANTARGAMCGAGLVIPEVTCFDHQSDWEGVTVVLDDATKAVQAVNYAAHKFVVRVPWPTARAAGVAMAEGSRLPAAAVDERPVVFIARGTHAAYPQACAKDFCPTGALSNDNEYDGHNPWSRNGCLGCVSLFPATTTGPASWNAFPGHWGTAFCAVRDFYCSRSDAPRSPWAQHGRFAHPWCVTHVEMDLGRRPRPVGVPCAKQG